MAEFSSRIGDLGVLAADPWWSWHLEARSLFAELSPALWKESGENPVRLLRRRPVSALAAAADSTFCGRYDRVMHRFRQDLSGRHGWFEEARGTGSRDRHGAGNGARREGADRPRRNLSPGPFSKLEGGPRFDRSPAGFCGTSRL